MFRVLCPTSRTDMGVLVSSVFRILASNFFLAGPVGHPVISDLVELLRLQLRNSVIKHIRIFITFMQDFNAYSFSFGLDLYKITRKFEL